ncbi:chromosomal replication initiator protein DnaA [Trichococcus pasteurii]|uniref:Chromosomal replication initiator protein DnaA n=1 Tax=Trichococcus pasteurii TaxID=43064 RepID=A0A1W1IGB0_9LACT|nr:chromosomal replication initiator protein DnaA [Trichococcus pasteurii]SFE81744.1 chromosomal replication initiator protein [Trichococcus pasteurii]SLM52064.1 bacterial chromosomal replication initiator (dnaa) signature [Trichococcus pasteurii]SSB92945.1 bacterial chromosomal replication initiator (dnaa) signature [Trichococcus pasteurii]
MDDIYSLWRYLQEKFQESLSKVSYDTWIDSAVPVRLTDTNIIIEVPSSLHKDYWQNNLMSRIVEGIYEFSGKELTPIFMIKNEEMPDIAKPTIKRTNNNRLFKDAQLNSKYTFDTFVIGKGNQMAHAAALVVAEEPGTIYNPLFFYGGVGLGKTHLMHAIGHQMLQLRPTAKVKYVSSETFANDFINSIQNRTQEQFRNEYRSVDLLMVDDIQFFADKEGTQEEFFHTFNALYDERKQIVLTSDRLPNEIPKLQERLVSRFAWGLSVDITPPDLETRIAILRKKANSERLEIPDDTLSYIAGQIDSNIRELEGALVRVQAYSAIQGTDITTSLAADALKSIMPSEKPKALSIYAIQQAVGKYYHVTVEELKGKKRTKGIVVPRQIAMYLSRVMTDNSLPKIGSEFGGKDHTTVIHAHDKIALSVKKDPVLQREIETIQNSLKK